MKKATLLKNMSKLMLMASDIADELEAANSDENLAFLERKINLIEKDIVNLIDLIKSIEDLE